MSLNIQHQIRENTHELQSFISDLNQWTGSVKEKDKALREGRVEQAGTSAQQQPVRAPPIRGRAPAPPDNAPVAKPLRREKDGSSAEKTGSAAAHTYDKSKERWEKFDVDAALKDVDNADSGAGRRARWPTALGSRCLPLKLRSTNVTWVGASGASRSSRPSGPQPQQDFATPQQDPMARIFNAPLPPSDPAVAAEAAKQDGNEAFKSGDYGLAVAHYTTSLAAKPTAVTFANRAMARLKLAQHAEAEADCTQAIALDPRYLKAYQRRSAARRALARLLPAIEDCEAALRLEPGSKALREERTSLIRDFQAAEKLTPTAVAVPLSIRPLPDLAAPVAPGPSSAPPPADSGERGAVQGSPSGQGAAAAEATGISAVRGNAAATAATQPASTATEGAAAAAGERASADAVGRARSESAQSVAAAAAAKVAARPLPIPRNGTEFEKAWRSASADADAQAQLLRALDPATLPALLKDSLTGPVLKAVLKAALGLLAPRDALATSALLQALISVPRFGLAVMSLSSKDKPELSALWDAACAAALKSGVMDAAAGLESLRPQFRL